jgi:HAD superfamily hydrolase (TIGR01509 family)
MLFLIDLDGTLVNSDHLHYEAYAKVLGVRPEQIQEIVETIGMTKFLSDFTNPEGIREEKLQEMLKIEYLELNKNADKFINFIIDNDINHAVVTNSNRRVVEHFKSKLPILNKLENWVVREDYVKPKPNPECYQLAINLYGKNETCVLGFENSKEGIHALSGVTKHIFHIQPQTDYLKVIDVIKTQCQKRSGMPPTNLNRMAKRKLKLLIIVSAMAGSLALGIVLSNLRKGYQTYSARDMDCL